MSTQNEIKSFEQYIENKDDALRLIVNLGSNSLNDLVNQLVEIAKIGLTRG